MQGYEGLIAIQENNQGWTGTYQEPTNLSRYYLFADSVNLSVGQAINENEDKLIKGASPLAFQRTYGARTPGGEITLQPRSNDCLGILMACFQNKDVTGSTLKSASGTWNLGTWVFYRGESGSFTWLGSNAYGTKGTTAQVYSIDVIEKWADTLSSGSLARVFESCVVSDIEFTAAIGEELKITPSLKAYNVSWSNTVTNPPNSAGSYSVRPAFVQKAGTLIVTYTGTAAIGTTWNITSFSHRHSNNNMVKSVIGRRDPQNYPYGKTSDTGVIELELDDTSHQMNFLNDAGTYAIKMRFQNASDDVMEIDCPSVKLANVEHELVSGMVPNRLSYTAYRPLGGSCAMQLTVICRGTATSLHYADNA